MVGGGGNASCVASSSLLCPSIDSPPLSKDHRRLPRHYRRLRHGPAAALEAASAVLTHRQLACKPRPRPRPHLTKFRTGKVGATGRRCSGASEGLLLTNCGGSADRATRTRALEVPATAAAVSARAPQLGSEAMRHGTESHAASGNRDCFECARMNLRCWVSPAGRSSSRAMPPGAWSSLGNRSNAGRRGGKPSGI